MKLFFGEVLKVGYVHSNHFARTLKILRGKSENIYLFIFHHVNNLSSLLWPSQLLSFGLASNESIFRILQLLFCSKFLQFFPTTQKHLWEDQNIDLAFF